MFRIDIVLHAFFILPALLALYGLLRWRDLDLVLYALLIVVIYTGVFLFGFHTNRSILRRDEKGMVLPALSSLLWVFAFPLVGSLGVFLLQDRFLLRLGPSDFSVVAGIFVEPPWIFLLFLMVAYKGLYLVCVHQHKIWSKRIPNAGLTNRSSGVDELS